MGRRFSVRCICVCSLYLCLFAASAFIHSSDLISELDCRSRRAGNRGCLTALRNISCITKCGVVKYSVILVILYKTGIEKECVMNLYQSSLYMDDVQYAANLSLPWDKLGGKSVMLSGSTGLLGSFLIDVLMEKNRAEGLHCTVCALGRNPEKAVRYCALRKRRRPRRASCLL